MTTVLIANPSADIYGSDLQMLDSISGLKDRQFRVIVSVPGDGPLVSRLRERGAEVIYNAAPVVRRSAMSPLGVARLAAESVIAAVRLRRTIRRHQADVVYVNTITIPIWLIAAKLARRPSLCHVHEAEDADSKLVLKGLLAPLHAATTIVVNSKAATSAIEAVYPRLARRAVLIYNGIPNPPESPAARSPGKPFKVAAVCRLSPRKAPDVAIEAIARLRAAGRDVQLTIYGTPFAGYEWYENELRDRASEPDLAGSVFFGGYVSPVWDALAGADAVVAPSLREPFGNAVVEAQFARRPVVASATMGHLETVSDGKTGLLVRPNDPDALATAIATLMDDPDLARRLAENGRHVAATRFSVARYASDIAELTTTTLG